MNVWCNGLFWIHLLPKVHWVLSFPRRHFFWRIFAAFETCIETNIIFGFGYFPSAFTRNQRQLLIRHLMPSTPESLDITTGLNEKLSAIEASPSSQLSQKILSALFFFVFFIRLSQEGLRRKRLARTMLERIATSSVAKVIENQCRRVDRNRISLTK